LTEHGAALVALPRHPRLPHMLVLGEQLALRKLA